MPTRSRSRAARACRCTSLTRISASPAIAGARGELLALIDAARDDGVDITLDTYPYLAGATYLHALLPGWVHAGGPEAIIARLRDPDLRERLRVELEETGSDGFHDVPVEWDTLVLDGVTIADLAERAGKRPIDVYCERCADSHLSASALVHFGNEENVRATMQHPAHTAGSDGILVGERPHPRGWGTFARYLAVYVRELGVLGLSECVRHMTSLPAQRLGLADRGLVRPGMAADITVFDPDGVRDSPPTRSRAASQRDSSTWPSTASWCSTAVRTPAPRRGAHCGAAS